MRSMHYVLSLTCWMPAMTLSSESLHSSGAEADVGWHAREWDLLATTGGPIKAARDGQQSMPACLQVWRLRSR